MIRWRFRAPRTEQEIARRGGTLPAVAETLFQEAAEGLLVLDGRLRVMRGNAALTRLRAGEAAAPGTPGLLLFAVTDRETLRAELLAAVTGAPARRGMTMRLAISSGEGPALDVAIIPVREADGACSGLVLRLSDVTARQRLEAELGQARRLQAVGLLAGGIAHDFNNLLTAILQATELALGRPALDAETAEELGQIRASAERGAALVHQLLAFGRQQTLLPCAVAVNGAVRGIAGLLRRLLGEKVRVELELEEPGRNVQVDPAQLDQVLMNLAVNARDAMPEGGILRLVTGHETLLAPRTSGAETIPPGRYVTVVIADTGAGIPAEVLPRIFEPFFTTKRERGGTGLGLATVHGIIRQSGGFLSVESAPGQGTSFLIHLPRLEAGTETPSAPAVLPVVPPESIAPHGDGETVLLVEDEEPVRRLAARALAARGFTVLAAESAEAALALLDEQPPASLGAVVSDVVMPGIDGPALVRQLRERFPALRAILVSGYAEATLRADLATAEALFLAKPYSLEALLTALRPAPDAGN